MINSGSRDTEVGVERLFPKTEPRPGLAFLFLTLVPGPNVSGIYILGVDI